MSNIDSIPVGTIVKFKFEHPFYLDIGYDRPGYGIISKVWPYENSIKIVYEVLHLSSEKTNIFFVEPNEIIEIFKQNNI